MKKIKELAKLLVASGHLSENPFNLGDTFIAEKDVQRDLHEAGLDWNSKTQRWYVNSRGAITGYHARDIDSIEKATDIAEQYGWDVRNLRRKYNINRLAGKNRVLTWQEEKTAMKARLAEKIKRGK